MELKVRRLEPPEAALAASVVRTFAAKEVSVADLKKFLSNPANYLIVAEMDGELAGFLLAHALERLKEASRKMFIYEIEVKASCRRQGVGTALIRYVRGIVRREGMMSAFVFTNYSNDGAVKFYQSTGAKVAKGDDLLFVYDG